MEEDMNKPFIMTHTAIFVLALCTLINYINSLEHMCCDGGPYYYDIVWYLAFIMFFSFMMIIFDILVLIKNNKGRKKDDM